MHRMIVFSGFCCLAATACALFVSAGAPIAPTPRVARWCSISELPLELGLEESVFWEPRDTESLRKVIRESPMLIQGKDILEIGTGSGLLALCCASAGAKKVVATDVNPRAISSAEANARRFGYAIDFRLVPTGKDADSGAFSVVSPDEQFDVIISNPPWEDDTPEQWADYALYDPGFHLLRSILLGYRQHLRPGGRLMLAYGCVDAIHAAQSLGDQLGIEILILDERDPATLPNVFLPGMLLGVIHDGAP